MKKVFLISISILYSTLMFSQTFNVLYDTPDDIFFEDLIRLDSAYVFVGNKVGTNQSIFLWLDLEGNIIKDSVEVISSSWQMKSIVELSSGFALVETNNFSSLDIIRVRVCNSQFQTLRQYNITGASNYSLVKSKLINDSILAMPGSIEDLGTTAYQSAICFLNINSGEDTIITFGTTSILNFAADVVYIGGKYYVTQSAIEFYNPSLNSNTYSALSRWNADFSFDTIVPVYNSASDSYYVNIGFFSIVSALKLSDSTFLMSGRTRMASSPNPPNPPMIPYDIGVVKWDTSLTELNAVTFGVKDSTAIEAFQALSRFEDDPFVYAGGTERYVIVPGGFGTTTSYFMLSKMDLDGNVMWTRYYTNNNHLLMHKVMATSDGGAIMMGKSYDHRTANGLENDLWIVKVDSNGNMNNQTTSLAENGEILEDNYVFFPNPASDHLTFRQLNIVQEYQLNLFDSNGKLLYQDVINKSEKTIDVSTYSKGVYFYVLYDKAGNKASGKLVKQ